MNVTIQPDQRDLVLKLYNGPMSFFDCCSPTLTGIIMNGWAVVGGEGPVCMPMDQVTLTKKGIQLAKTLSIPPVSNDS